MRRPTALAITAALIVAACSGDDEAAPTTAASPATAASTTTAATPSTQPPPTQAPTTTPPPTTPALTTTPPPTTAPRNVVAEVTQAALAYDAWYVECLRNPPGCDPSVVAVEASDVFVNLTIVVEELTDAGFYVGPEDPGYVVIEGVEVLDDHVRVTVCGWGTMVLYGPPGPDGNPTIQNDTRSTVRETWQFVDQNGRWMLRRTDTTEEVEGVNQCPPEL